MAHVGFLPVFQLGCKLKSLTVYSLSTVTMQVFLALRPRGDSYDPTGI